MPLGWGKGKGFFLSRVACHECTEKIIPKRVTKAHLDSPRDTRGFATCDSWGIQMGFRDSFGNYFSFHSWQATRERKKPVPLPQPKGIKTILRSAMRLQTFSTNSFSLTSMCSASCFSHHQHHRLSRMGPPTTSSTSQYTKVHVDKIWSLFSFCKNLDSNFQVVR